MHHLLSHPSPVPGCFGCQTIRQGVQTLKIKHGADPVQRIPVVTEDGARRGTVGGQHAVHWDGRQDATVRPPQLRIDTKVREI